MVRSPPPQRFAERLLADTSAAGVIALAAIGDRLGLFKDLAQRGPATAQELADRTGLSPRHLTEWLAALSSAGYLTCDAATLRYALPEEHAALADESHPDFLGGAHEALLGFLKPLDRIVETFRTRGGVPHSAYPEQAYAGLDRFAAARIERELVAQWLPAAGLTGRLATGIAVADLGCGRGRALLSLARAFPRSRFFGFDLYGPNVAHAQKAAARAGLSPRVQFLQRDAAEGLPERYDLVTTFDVVHEAVDPLALLRSIRKALAPRGAWLCSQPLPPERPAPLSTFLLAASVLHGLSTSLAHGGAALGPYGLSEDRLAALAAAAGFPRPRRIAVASQTHCLFALEP